MRGGVFPIRPPRDAVGHEQQGQRYCVVVTAQRYLRGSRWQVVPTSSSARSGLIRPEIDLGGELGRTVALCDDLRSVDPERRLGDLIGYLNPEHMQDIERALTGLLGLAGRDDLF